MFNKKVEDIIYRTSGANDKKDYQEGMFLLSLIATLFVLVTLIFVVPYYVTNCDKAWFYTGLVSQGLLAFFFLVMIFAFRPFFIKMSEGEAMEMLEKIKQISQEDYNLLKTNVLQLYKTNKLTWLNLIRSYEKQMKDRNKANDKRKQVEMKNKFLSLLSED